MRTWKGLSAAVPTLREKETIQIVAKFITPVFGGGVDPKKRDEVTPVRAAALRGQLRFWWRATSSLAEEAALWKAETEIFGGVHGAKGSVASDLAVVVTRQPTRVQDRSVFENGDAFKVTRDTGVGLAYGAFPLRSTDGSKIHGVLFRYMDEFEITMQCSRPAADEVRRALWALFHFGGLGGRTRRGFGALELLTAKGFELSGIEEGWPTSLPKVPRWPVLSDWRVSGSIFENPTDAMEQALRLLREMRQGGLGRRPGQSTRAGRSRWPEPDAIRALYPGRQSARHSTRLLQFDKYPRAAFGAPVIFHFKTATGEVEPPDVTLVPTRYGKPLERMASPLLLRPHREPDGRYRALAVRLAHPEPGWALVEGKRVKVAEVEHHLELQEAEKIDALSGYSSDPVEAYLKRLSRL